MIDIEIDIFDSIAGRLRNRFSGIEVKNELDLSPQQLPCATIEEADNYAVTETQDTSNNENHVYVMCEANTFSNKHGAKKRECKAIMAEIDSYFNEIGFTRISLTPAYSNNPTIARMTARYVAIVGKDKTIYRR